MYFLNVLTVEEVSGREKFGENFFFWRLGGGKIFFLGSVDCRW